MASFCLQLPSGDPWHRDCSTGGHQGGAVGTPELLGIEGIVSGFGGSGLRGDFGVSV